MAQITTQALTVSLLSDGTWDGYVDITSNTFVRVRALVTLNARQQPPRSARVLSKIGTTRLLLGDLSVGYDRPIDCSAYTVGELATLTQPVQTVEGDEDENDEDVIDELNLISLDGTKTLTLGQSNTEAIINTHDAATDLVFQRAGTEIARMTGSAVTVAVALSALNLSGTNSGDITLAAVGVTPNANAGSLIGQVLSLQPASSTFPGIITTAAQSFGGSKTFDASVVLKGGPWFDIRAYGAIGDGTTDCSAAITNAIAAAGAVSGTLLIPPGTFRINSNVTTGSTVISTRFMKGGVIRIPSGVTLTLNGGIEAGPVQIFDCIGTPAGVVTMSVGYTEEVSPNWWGAIGADSIDSTAAFRAALATPISNVRVATGRYKIRDTTGTNPVVLTTNKRLIGSGPGISTISADTLGAVFDVTGNKCEISDLQFIPYTGAGALGATNVYGAVKIRASRCIFRNLWMVNPGTGLYIYGVGGQEAHFNRITGLDITAFRDYGVRIGGGLANNNYIHFSYMYGPGTGQAWESAGFWLENGQNEIVGGEIALCRWAAIYEGDTTNLNAYIEQTDKWFWSKSTAGVNYFTGGTRGIGAFPVQIDGGHLVGPSGLEYTDSQMLSQQDHLSTKDMKAFYLFNEGSGEILRDLSGNGNHLLHNAGLAASWSDGRWSPGLVYDPPNGRWLAALPAAAVDLAQLFTVAFAVRVESVGGIGPIAFSIQDASGSYTRALASQGGVVVQDASYPLGIPTLVQNAARAPGYLYGDGRWVVHVLEFDQANSVIRHFNPLPGAIAPISGTWAMDTLASGTGRIYVGSDAGHTGGIDGRIGFFGVWQRALTTSEVMDLGNYRLPFEAGKPASDVRLSRELVGPTGTRMREWSGVAAPVAGAYVMGDKVWNVSPVAGGVVGWVCTVAGSPGTWKEFGPIAL